MMTCNLRGTNITEEQSDFIYSAESSETLVPVYQTTVSHCKRQCAQNSQVQNMIGRQAEKCGVQYNPYLLKSLHEACFHHGLQHQRILGKPGHRTCSECLQYILIHSQHLRTHNEATRKW